MSVKSGVREANWVIRNEWGITPGEQEEVSVPKPRGGERGEKRMRRG